MKKALLVFPRMHDFFDALPHFYPEVTTNTISFLKMARISLIEAQKTILVEKYH